MTGLNLASLLIAVFLAGAYLALLARALIEASTQRRLVQATKDELAPEDFERLRAYIGQVNEGERARVGTKKPPPPPAPVTLPRSTRG